MISQVIQIANDKETVDHLMDHKQVWSASCASYDHDG